MRSSTLKWIILLSTLVIGLLVLVQLFWLNRIYHYDQKEFTTSVIKSIQGVYEDLELSDSSSRQLQKLIEQPTSNTFLFRVDSIPQKDTLLADMLANLEDFGVFSDCKLGLYDNDKRKYIYESYIPSAGTKDTVNTGNPLPVFKKNYPYVLLFFPHRSQYILYSMVWWISSGIFLLVILIALGLSIFFLYRQKFVNETQNDFIRNVTHEFQTPLTTLTVGLDAIGKINVQENREKLFKYVTLMQGQTAYLKQHIENLMKVLKTEANGLVLDKLPVAPNELIKDAITQLAPAIEEKNAEIELLLENTNGHIMGDKSSLFVAILNVISNAIKFSPDPHIIIDTKISSGWYIISIKDNGIGIEEQYIKKLFKKFFRVPTGDIHNVKGLGLGLYFVKKVIDGHNGAITLTSIPGKGTEFIIRLTNEQ